MSSERSNNSDHFFDNRSWRELISSQVESQDSIKGSDEDVLAVAGVDKSRPLAPSSLAALAGTSGPRDTRVRKRGGPGRVRGCSKPSVSIFNTGHENKRTYLTRLGSLTVAGCLFRP
jgi:hypothetical protein